MVGTAKVEAAIRNEGQCAIPSVCNGEGLIWRWRTEALNCVFLSEPSRGQRQAASAPHKAKVHGPFLRREFFHGFPEIRNMRVRGAAAGVGGVGFQQRHINHWAAAHMHLQLPPP